MTNQSPWKTIPAGTIVDTHLKKLCETGTLITENYNERSIKQACYELRSSNIYYDVYNSNAPIEINDDEYILIKPKQCIVSITKESLLLPSDVLGRILTKGKLFSIGISAVNTYADPGFSGRIGIVLINLSNKYIKLKPGESIAKIEFSRLPSNVEKPYSGQHGYETEIWPIPTGMTLTEDEITNDKRILNEIEEISLSLGPQLGRHLQRIFKFERRFLSFNLIALFILFVLLLIFNKLTPGAAPISWTQTLIGGLVINGITQIIIYFATHFRSK